MYREWKISSPLWKNYTRFLATSLYLVRDGTCTFSLTFTAKTNGFIDQLLDFLFAPGQTPEVIVVLEIINELNQNPYETFVKALENERENRWRETKKKKKNAEFYIQVTTSLT